MALEIGNRMTDTVLQDPRTADITQASEQLPAHDEEAAQVEAAPAQDTWVLRRDGYDYYVKAGSPEYTPTGMDVAPEFSCRVAHNGKVRHYRFRARGVASLYVDRPLLGG